MANQINHQLENFAQNPYAQAGAGGLTYAGVKSEHIVAKIEAGAGKFGNWYDPFWDIIWAAAPWEQLAQVLGPIFMMYSIFVIIKNHIFTPIGNYFKKRKLKNKK